MKFREAISAITAVAFAAIAEIAIRNPSLDAPGLIRPICYLIGIIAVAIFLAINGSRAIVAYLLFLIVTVAMTAIDVINTPAQEISGQQGWYTMPIAIAIYSLLPALVSIAPFAITYHLTKRLIRRNV